MLQEMFSLNHSIQTCQNAWLAVWVGVAFSLHRLCPSVVGRPEPLGWLNSSSSHGSTPYLRYFTSRYLSCNKFRLALDSISSCSTQDSYYSTWTMNESKAMQRISSCSNAGSCYKQRGEMD